MVSPDGMEAMYVGCSAGASLPPSHFIEWEGYSLESLFSKVEQGPSLASPLPTSSFLDARDLYESPDLYVTQTSCLRLSKFKFLSPQPSNSISSRVWVVVQKVFPRLKASTLTGLSSSNSLLWGIIDYLMSEKVVSLILSVFELFTVGVQVQFQSLSYLEVDVPDAIYVNVMKKLSLVPHTPTSPLTSSLWCATSKAWIGSVWSFWNQNIWDSPVPELRKKILIQIPSSFFSHCEQCHQLSSLTPYFKYTHTSANSCSLLSLQTICQCSYPALAPY